MISCFFIHCYRFGKFHSRPTIRSVYNAAYAYEDEITSNSKLQNCGWKKGDLCRCRCEFMRKYVEMLGLIKSINEPCGKVRNYKPSYLHSVAWDTLLQCASRDFEVWSSLSSIFRRILWCGYNKPWNLHLKRAFLDYHHLTIFHPWLFRWQTAGSRSAFTWSFSVHFPCTHGIAYIRYGTSCQCLKINGINLQ